MDNEGLHSNGETTGVVDSDIKGLLIRATEDLPIKLPDSFNKDMATLISGTLDKQTDPFLNKISKKFKIDQSIKDANFKHLKELKKLNDIYKINQKQYESLVGLSLSNEEVIKNKDEEAISELSNTLKESVPEKENADEFKLDKNLNEEKSSEDDKLTSEKSADNSFFDRFTKTLDNFSISKSFTNLKEYSEKQKNDKKDESNKEKENARTDKINNHLISIEKLLDKSFINDALNIISENTSLIKDYIGKPIEVDIPEIDPNQLKKDPGISPATTESVIPKTESIISENEKNNLFENVVNNSSSENIINNTDNSLIENTNNSTEEIVNNEFIKNNIYNDNSIKNSEDISNNISEKLVPASEEKYPEYFDISKSILEGFESLVPIDNFENISSMVEIQEAKPQKQIYDINIPEKAASNLIKEDKISNKDLGESNPVDINKVYSKGSNNEFDSQKNIGTVKKNTTTIASSVKTTNDNLNVMNGKLQTIIKTLEAISNQLNPNQVSLNNNQPTPEKFAYESEAGSSN